MKMNEYLKKNIWDKVRKSQEEIFIYDNKENIINFLEKFEEILKVSNPLLYEVDYKKIVNWIAKEYLILKKEVKFPIIENDKDKIIVKTNHHLKQCGWNAFNHDSVPECPLKKENKND